MKLNVGDAAPTGLVVAVSAEEVDLAGMWANGPTMLTFLRHFG